MTTITKPSIQTVTEKLRPVWRYRLVFFIIFVASLRGYLVLRINSAVNITPSEATEMTVSRRTPRVDPAVVQKLQSLQDNSVSVQALFNEARENPFQ